MTTTTTKTCTVDGCDRPASARGMCDKHYRRTRNNGDPHTTRRRRHDPVCSIDGCDSPHQAGGYCSSHYNRFRRYGNPTAGAPQRATMPRYIEDVEWMADTGENLDGAAARYGLTPKSLDDWLRAQHRPDLARRLRARNPIKFDNAS